MTQFDSPRSGDGDRDALATLVARFSADRDALAAALQRTETAVHALAARVEAVAVRPGDAVTAADLGALRAEVARLDAALEGVRQDVASARTVSGAAEGAEAPADTSALASAIDEVRTELRRSGIELTAALEEVRLMAAASGEQAAEALAQAAGGDGRAHEIEALRAGVGALRDELLRRVDGTEARLGVRLDSIVAGVEAESRAVRDGLWDRVADAERRLHDAEATLATVRVQLPQAAAQALEGIAGLHEGLDDLRVALDAAGARLRALEERPGGLGGLVACIRDEVVAAVMLVASVGAVVGRLTLSFVR